MRARWLVFGIGASVGVIASAPGCGSSAQNGFEDPDAGVTVDLGNVADGESPDPVFPSFGDATDSPSPGCGVRCSSDLHSVVDCNSNILKTCPPDQGCSPGGACVPACDSAKANKSTIGCDYFSVDPDVILGNSARCFAAFIANTWSAPVTITVERDGKTLPVADFARIPSGNGKAITYAPLPNGQLPPGEVAIVFLAEFGSSIKCPVGVTPAYTTADAALHGTGLGHAFHLTTSAPVVAYDVYPYGGGPSAITSATLLLPTTAWDTNYIAVNAFRKSTIAGQPSLDIVAAEDATTVTISPSAAIVGGVGVEATGKGQPRTYTLNKGQILQFTQDEELTGSPIQSDKPIAIWGAASCMNIPITTIACDGAHQQIPPVKALGHEYAAVRYRNRLDGKEESPPWRLVGAVDGTTLTYDPAAPPGAPSSLASGEVAEYATGTPFVVKSQDDKHPFYMSGHMTGCGDLGTSSTVGCAGDPEFVNVIPPQQYLSSYVFFTDPTYPETNLVLVRSKGASGFKDVTIDCGGVIAGWQPLGGSGAYEYTRMDLVRHNFEKQGSCDNGRREIHSEAPFGLTVWGWGTSESVGFSSQAVSYAYPAGASIQPINTVVVPPVPK